MTDGDHSHDPPGVRLRAAPPRRWWEKQRFIIPISLLILAPAVFVVAGIVRAGDPTLPIIVHGSEGAAATVPVDGDGVAQTRADGEGGDAGDAAGGSASRATPATVPASAADPGSQKVCRRILALRDEFENRGVNPVHAYIEMMQIQRDARDTVLAAEVDEAIGTMEDFVAGRADTGAVVTAGTTLASAC